MYLKKWSKDDLWDMTIFKGLGEEEEPLNGKRNLIYFFYYILMIDIYSQYLDEKNMASVCYSKNGKNIIYT